MIGEEMDIRIERNFTWWIRHLRTMKMQRILPPP